MDALIRLNTLLVQLAEGDKVTGCVYHYRGSYDSLINILKKGQLRMTDYLFLPGEIHYAKSFLKEKVQDKKLKFPPAKKNITQSSFWDCFEFYQKQLRVFITSLCLNRDDQHLWQVYGKSGLGFAIGFSKDYINSAFLKNNIEGAYNKSNWTNVVMKVHYGENELSKIANEILEVLSYIDKISNPKYYWDILINLYSKIIPELPRFKEFGTKNKFELEKEYRLYAIDLDPSKKRIPESLIVNDENPRMYSEHIPRQHITEILVGSKHNFDEIEHKIREDLKEHFSKKEIENLNITRSEVSFD